MLAAIRALRACTRRSSLLVACTGLALATFGPARTPVVMQLAPIADPQQSALRAP